jgi:hypothetical protein
VPVALGWFGIGPQLRYAMSTIRHALLLAHGRRHTPPTHTEPALHGWLASQNGCGRVSGTQTPSSSQYRSAELQAPPEPQAA